MSSAGHFPASQPPSMWILSMMCEENALSHIATSSGVYSFWGEGVEKRVWVIKSQAFSKFGCIQKQFSSLWLYVRPLTCFLCLLMEKSLKNINILNPVSHRVRWSHFFFFFSISSSLIAQSLSLGTVPLITNTHWENNCPTPLFLLAWDWPCGTCQNG